MRVVGFSTGALAYSDFRRALSILKRNPVTAVELSALRENELLPLVDALDSLDLSQFGYISIHAPSRYEHLAEGEIVASLKRVLERKWPIVLHPDTIRDFSLWQEFADFLLIENMDKRNRTGRTAEELSAIFNKLPSAGLCLDIGHCRQVDPTMNETFLILRNFRSRLRQLHVSEVNSRSTHDPLSEASIAAFRSVSHLIPEDVPLILESPVDDTHVESEIRQARYALPAHGAREGLTRVETRPFHAAII